MQHGGAVLAGNAGIAVGLQPSILGARADKLNDLRANALLCVCWRRRIEEKTAQQGRKQKQCRKESRSHVVPPFRRLNL